ncbi:hypothetical protein CH373_05870 [Leptospira perolatii]|uniref:Lipoprotein n=1 Tax=Leptospira perolatii TaxID=2023191 RepID=A0A2M9ZQT1_9LEPT|nr:TIGR04452 family lipoprotein [Leptospira perolatii]PJZ68382.1 hypothetical protein CH360_16535 [Leptospira perolatii]PJZ74422.1 hypothetical protein CH373_05870 [Leptospira perolatii]
MKKLLSIFFFVMGASLSNCVALDVTGLSGSIKGTEAAQRINDAALKTDIISFAVMGQSDFFISSLFTAEAAKIEPDKYYKKADVDECIENIKTINVKVIVLLGVPLTPFQTALFTCSLKPNGLVI